MGKKILLVDDEKDLVEATKLCLELQKYEVIVAYDGQEALKKIPENPDLIILDVMMPGMNGFQVLEKLRRELKIITPIIMLTSQRDSRDIFKAQELGVSDYIMKPFEPKELLELIRRFL